MARKWFTHLSKIGFPKVTSTENLEETLDEYVRFLDMATGELLVAIPDPEIGLYSNQKLKDAFEEAYKRGVNIRILSNKKTRVGLPGHQYEAARVVLHHYVVSDRKYTFLGRGERGAFYYKSHAILPMCESNFEGTPILSAVA